MLLYGATGATPPSAPSPANSAPPRPPPRLRRTRRRRPDPMPPRPDLAPPRPPPHPDPAPSRSSFPVRRPGSLHPNLQRRLSSATTPVRIQCHRALHFLSGAPAPSIPTAAPPHPPLRPGDLQLGPALCLLFERMYATDGVPPDEVIYFAVLDVYAQLGMKEEVLALFDRARGSGWKPDHVAFAVLAKMFGEAGDYEGIQFVFKEMTDVGVEPNIFVYNALLEALGKTGKPGLARSLFEEKVNPNLVKLIRVLGDARVGVDDITRELNAVLNAATPEVQLSSNVCGLLELQTLFEPFITDM